MYHYSSNLLNLEAISTKRFGVLFVIIESLLKGVPKISTIPGIRDFKYHFQMQYLLALSLDGLSAVFMFPEANVLTGWLA